jgi:hypothetical protein
MNRDKFKETEAILEKQGSVLQFKNLLLKLAECEEGEL